MDILISGAKIGSPHCVTNWGGQGSRRKRDTGDTVLISYYCGTSFCMFSIFLSFTNIRSNAGFPFTSKDEGTVYLYTCDFFPIS